jgi:hypothetical protein
MVLYLVSILVEAVLVGAFCVVLYLGVQWIKPFLLLLFVLGFLKHGLGYLSGLESLYCNDGQACQHSFLTEAHSDHILSESILEGLVFVLGGLLLYKVKSKVVAVFLLGLILHLVAEWTGLHTRFCQENCRRH